MANKKTPNKSVEPAATTPIFYQREGNKITITGTKEQVGSLIAFDLISSKIIKGVRWVAGLGLGGLVRRFMQHL